MFLRSEKHGSDRGPSQHAYFSCKTTHLHGAEPEETSPNPCALASFSPSGRTKARLRRGRKNSKNQVRKCETRENTMFQTRENDENRSRACGVVDTMLHAMATQEVQDEDYTILSEICSTVVTKARTGDIGAIRLLFERISGAPVTFVVGMGQEEEVPTEIGIS